MFSNIFYQQNFLTIMIRYFLDNVFNFLPNETVFFTCLQLSKLLNYRKIPINKSSVIIMSLEVESD